MGVVSLSNIQVYGYIGVRPEEKAAGRWFSVSVHIDFHLKKAGETDDVAHTVDYGKVAEVVKIAMKTKHNLLEAACRSIAEKVLAHYPSVEKMEVIIRKMHPFLEAQVEAAEIRWNYPEDFLK